jgi:aspartate aminotransferase
MVLTLSNRMNSIKPSATLAMAQAARDLAKKGVDIAMLSTGEPDCSTPSIIRDVAKQSLDQGKTHYVPVRGTKNMLEAMCLKFLRDQKVSYRDSEVMCTVGGKSAIWLALQALISEGDEVILCSPYWVSYKEQVLLAGGRPVFIECKPENNFMPAAADLAKAITKKTKVVILNSPNNPTGGVISHAQMQSLCELLHKEDIWLISDEIYEKLLFDDNVHISPVSINQDMKNRTIVISGVSKAYAMTGFRVGVVAGPAKIIAIMEILQGQDATCLPEFIQDAAAFALKEDEPVKEAIASMLKTYQIRLNKGISLFGSWPKVKLLRPQGAFYLWVDFSAYIGQKIANKIVLDDIDLAMRMLAEAHVSSVPGSAFGAPSYLRFSIASSMESIIKAHERIYAWLG